MAKDYKKEKETEKIKMEKKIDNKKEIREIFIVIGIIIIAILYFFVGLGTGYTIYN